MKPRLIDFPSVEAYRVAKKAWLRAEKEARVAAARARIETERQARITAHELQMQTGTEVPFNGRSRYDPFSIESLSELAREEVLRRMTLLTDPPQPNIVVTGTGAEIGPGTIDYASIEGLRTWGSEYFVPTYLSEPENPFMAEETDKTTKRERKRVRLATTNALIDRDQAVKVGSGYYLKEETVTVLVINPYNYIDASRYVNLPNEQTISVSRKYFKLPPKQTLIQIYELLGFTQPRLKNDPNLVVLTHNSTPYYVDKNLLLECRALDIENKVRVEYCFAVHGFQTNEHLYEYREPVQRTNLYATLSYLEFVEAIEEISTGRFYPKGTTVNNQITACYQTFNSILSPRTLESLSKLQKIKFGLDSVSYNITEGLQRTFGVEIETSIGAIPSHISSKYNWKCVRDGSLKGDDGRETGGEYVTGVLKGDSGFFHLQKICLELQKRCRINHTCGVHVHVGINPTVRNIVSLYVLALKLQKEIFTMMPPSRRVSSHCKLVDNFPIVEFLKKAKTKEEQGIYLTETFKVIHQKIEYAGREASVQEMFFKSKHPLGDKCKYKKETPRYWWLNFVPALFIRDSFQGQPKDYKNFTIEFRPHSASLNFNKIKQWAKICIGLTEFAESYSHEVLSDKPLTLAYIMKTIYPKTGDTVVEYINSRVEKFKTAHAKAEEDTEYKTIESETLKPVKELIH